MSEPQYCYITLNRPTANDVGTIEEAHFVREGDLVVLTDSTGTPLARSTIPRRHGDAHLLRWERKVAAGEDAGRCARELLWARYRAAKGGSNNNRHIGPMTRYFGGVA